MDPEFRGDADHHDGTSDATPGGYPEHRRPGELVFALFLLGASLILLNEAYGISGFGKLSAPGTVPVATTAVMVICMVIVVLRTIRLPRITTETVARDILPGRVILFAVMLVLYGLALRPLGFLPTTALFLIGGIRLLGRGWAFSIGVGLGALIGIWIVFRMVFTVLMPPGIFPEAEVVQFFRSLAAGGAR
ncbi:MAG: tripartite tricarboxylate transporter TctB family protein [Gemmobacter sp.]